jgi:hypothetical protein
MSELFYVYEHLRNDTNQIFYVGKGKVGSGRSNITFGRNQYWKRVVKKANGFRVHKVVENVSELFAFQKEIERIAELKSAGIRLCNMTDGGDGASGYKHTEESLHKMSFSQLGEKGNMYGKHHPEKIKKKISEGGLGLKRSDETRKKISKAQLGEKNHQFGKKKSVETLAKLSEALSGKNHPMYGLIGEKSPNFGRKLSEETKNKIGRANSGKKHSIESRRLMSKKASTRAKITCPHCALIGSTNMTRWHFDNCKKIVQSPPIE